MKIGAVVSVVALVGLQLLFAATSANAWGTNHRVREPTTLTLLGAGTAAVAIGAWWRKRK